MMKNNTTIAILSISFCLFILSYNAVAQKGGVGTIRSNTGVSNMPNNNATNLLFASDEILEIKLTTDIKTLRKDIGDEREYHDATVSYTNDEDNEINLDIKIKTRGHFRRNPINCNFPPLRFDFRLSEVENTIFANQQKIKFVTHCQTKKEQYEQYILQEYLAYKVLNMLTDKSFRVRLVRISYVDLAGKENLPDRYGFFIEDNDKMAERLGGQIVEFKNVHPDRTEYKQITLVSLYQYFIGNTDWSVPSLHNIELVLTDSVKPPIAVPYDFDWSGIVNANYATPAPQLAIKTVRERLYRGYYRSAGDLQLYLQHFNDKRDEIYSLYNDFEPLDDKVRGRTIKYIDQFYSTINNPRMVNNIFVKGCRE